MFRDVFITSLIIDPRASRGFSLGFHPKPNMFNDFARAAGLALSSSTLRLSGGMLYVPPSAPARPPPAAPADAAPANTGSSDPGARLLTFGSQVRGCGEAPSPAGHLRRSPGDQDASASTACWRCGIRTSRLFELKPTTSQALFLSPALPRIGEQAFFGAACSTAYGGRPQIV